MEVLARANRQEKEMKGLQIENEETKLMLLVYSMIFYIENSTQKMLKLVTNMVKLQNTKSACKAVLLHTSIKLLKKKLIEESHLK